MPLRTEVFKDEATWMPALQPEVQRALRQAAEDVADRARTIAASRADSGDYGDSIRVRHDRAFPYGGIDWFVESTHPAAVSIEFGRTGARGKGGESRGVYALTGALAVSGMV